MTAIRDSQTSVGFNLFEQSLTKPTAKEKGLLLVFPEWDKDIIYVARYVDEIIISLAKKHNLWNPEGETTGGQDIDPDQLIPHILKVKGPNVVGVIGGIIQGNLAGREEVAILAGLLTRFVWDVPDAGDFVNIRRQADTKILFSIPKSVFTGEQLGNQNLTESKYQPLVGFLNDLKLVTRAYVDKVFGTVTENGGIESAKTLIGRMIGEYGDSVEIMHVQNPNIRDYLKQLYLDKAIREGREVLPWLRNPELWYLSQVNTLGILGVVNEVSCTPGISIDEIKVLGEFYDQVSSFVLVVLDDINDVEEDAFYGDPNFFHDLLSGKHLEQVTIMEQMYGNIYEYQGYQENNELAAKYFFALLGRAYLEKERSLLASLGKERAYKHQKMFRDMVKFYTLQLMMKGKTDDSFELECMNIFTFEVGDIVISP